MDAGRLFREHHPELLRYLLRLTGDADLAHDAAQEAFARLLASPPRNEHPRAWLFTVATNVVRSWASTTTRRLRLLQAAGARVPTADPPSPPDEAVLAAERRSAIHAALRELSDRERTVLLLREEGFTHREIAAAVGTTTGSVGTMIARALDKLAALLPLDADAL